jgi:hypothetical protein
MAPANRIVAFFDPNVDAPYSSSRSATKLSDILAWSDSKLELQHDYIQWLFPVPEASAYSWDAPVLSRADVDAFMEREEIRTNLRRAWVRMMRYACISSRARNALEDIGLATPLD